MGSTGRRRLGGRRPSGEPARRPPFGAPHPPWWGDESVQDWWLNELVQDGVLDEPAQDRWPDEPTRERCRYWPGPATRRRWAAAATRHPWFTAFGAGAGFLALAGGVIFILPGQSSSAMMTECGLVPCAAPMRQPVIPVPGPVASPSATHPTSRPAAQHVNPSPRPAASTVQAVMPSATASAVPQTPSTVTVTYALVESWDGGLLGEFTVVNDGSTTIPGWELAATFPGDQIQVTWGPIDPNPGGDSLVMQAQPDSPTIAPGASQTGYFIARGDTAFPSSCTFDGASCTAYGDPGQPVS